MERIVIVGYKPLPGKDAELKELMKTHWQLLDRENLVSKRKSIIMEAGDGTLIEIFGWKSKEVMESAHANPIVQKMWGEYAKVCKYVPVGDLKESKGLFSEFKPFN